MKEIFMALGWLLAIMLGYLNYSQAKQIDTLRKRLNTAEAGRESDHNVYRQILKDFAELVSDAENKKRVVERVDTIFDNAFREAERDKS